MTNAQRQQMRTDAMRTFQPAIRPQQPQLSQLLQQTLDRTVTGILAAVIDATEAAR